MVNYCCVQGCGRNSRTSKLLTYYCLPKDINRQVAWLKAAGREDLLEVKPEIRARYRCCSRHFEPSSIKNKHLCGDAVPTKNLPGYRNDSKEEDHSSVQPVHHNIICNSCNSEINGFRYKCVTCPDYDLCPKCEMLEIHPEHYVIRIPQPTKFIVADNLTDKWRQFFKANHVLPESSVAQESDSSDDEPITKYVNNYDSGIDLSEDVKSKIRDEVTRVLRITKDIDSSSVQKKVLKKRHGNDLERTSKKQKLAKIGDALEVAFADVNEMNSNNYDAIKHELPFTYEKPFEEFVSTGSDNNDLDKVLTALTFVTVKSDLDTTTNTAVE